MSEKGQGEESAAGTTTGVDGGAAAAGAAGGGGSQAAQSGPQETDDPLGGLTPADFPPPAIPEEPGSEPTFPGGGPTDTRSGWDKPGPPDSTAANVDLGTPEIPEIPREQADEPEFPGGGPTDTRTGWDKAGPPVYGEPHPTIPLDPRTRSDYDDLMGAIGSEFGKRGTIPEMNPIDPPDWDQPSPPSSTAPPPEMSDEQIKELKKKKPSIVDLTNTDDDKQIT